MQYLHLLLICTPLFSLQAVWRGYSLRQKLAVALASAQISEGEDDFDEVDVDEFAFDEVGGT